MYTQSATFMNEMGLNSRFAARFIQKSNTYQSAVSMEYNGKKTNGKSLLGILSLGARKGAEIVISAEGPDESDAVETLCEMIHKAENHDGGNNTRKREKAKRPHGLLSWLPFFRNRDADVERK
ncbi:MAG: HPr family phosphocarrier protein [Abditibacteriota bacterium]|nr:HPr family phosphocarrier protein [Abditibacteriota bacterium]